MRQSTPIRSLLLLLALISLVGMPYTVLMPIFADKILHGGPHTLGFLMAASGVGALAAALLLAMRKTVLGLGRGSSWQRDVRRGADRVRSLAHALAVAC